MKRSPSYRYRKASRSHAVDQFHNSMEGIKLDCPHRNLTSPCFLPEVPYKPGESIAATRGRLACMTTMSVTTRVKDTKTGKAVLFTPDFSNEQLDPQAVAAAASEDDPALAAYTEVKTKLQPEQKVFNLTLADHTNAFVRFSDSQGTKVRPILKSGFNRMMHRACTAAPRLCTEFHEALSLENSHRLASIESQMAGLVAIMSVQAPQSTDPPLHPPNRNRQSHTVQKVAGTNLLMRVYNL